MPHVPVVGDFVSGQTTAAGAQPSRRWSCRSPRTALQKANRACFRSELFSRLGSRKDGDDVATVRPGNPEGDTSEHPQHVRGSNCPPMPPRQPLCARHHFLPMGGGSSFITNKIKYKKKTTRSPSLRFSARSP